MELKEVLKNANVPQHVIELIENDARPIKNQEAIEKGDKITLVGFGNNGQAKINNVDREWVSIDCTGDRCNISMTNLIGTKKLTKHFPGYKQSEKTVRLSNDIRKAVIEVQQFFGKTLVCAEQVEVELPFTRTNANGEEVPATATYNIWEVVE